MPSALFKSLGCSLAIRQDGVYCVCSIQWSCCSIWVGAVLHKKNEISLPHKVICFFNRLMILAQNEIILLLPLFSPRQIIIYP